MRRAALACTHHWTLKHYIDDDLIEDKSFNTNIRVCLNWLAPKTSSLGHLLPTSSLKLRTNFNCSGLRRTSPVADCRPGRVASSPN